MKILLTIILLLASVTGAMAAYVISCSGGITAINQTGQYTTQVNGVNQTIVFDANYYDNILNATNCVINQVPDNTVYSGNALIH